MASKAEAMKRTLQIGISYLMTCLVLAIVYPPSRASMAGHLAGGLAFAPVVFVVARRSH